MNNAPKRFRFNKRQIDNLPAHDRGAKSREAEYTDTEIAGLKLLVSKSGRKFYYFRYTLGRRRAIKVGEHGPMTVQDARKRANEIRATLDRGIDPQQEKAKRLAMPTLREFADAEYLPHARASKRSHRDDASKLRMHILPRFGDRPLTDVTTKELQAYHNEIKKKRCPATANRHMSLLHRMFNLAMRWGHIEKNPAAGIKMHKENNARYRYLANEEIGRLMIALRSEPNRVAAAAIAFLLLTGTRRNEALNARWQHVNLEKGVWYLPDTKAGKSRHVVLNGQACNILRDLARVPGNPYVFPGRVQGKPLNNPTKAFRRVMAKAGIEDIRLHDLRHSFASLAINGGVGLYEVQHLLGHSSQQTTARYAHLGEDSLRKASAAVSEVVEKAVNG